MELMLMLQRIRLYVSFVLFVQHAACQYSRWMGFDGLIHAAGYDGVCLSIKEQVHDKLLECSFT